MSGGICLFTLNSSSVSNTYITVGKPASSGSDSIVCVFGGYYYFYGGGGEGIFSLGAGGG